MNTPKSKILKAALVATVMGATAVSAVPAQANQQNLSFSFQFNTNNGFSFGVGNSHRPRIHRHISRVQARRVLRNHGFRHIRNIRMVNHRFYIARAVKRGWVVRVKINAHNGQIVKRTRLHRR